MSSVLPNHGQCSKDQVFVNHVKDDMELTTLTRDGNYDPDEEIERSTALHHFAGARRPVYRNWFALDKLPRCGPIRLFRAFLLALFVVRRNIRTECADIW